MIITEQRDYSWWSYHLLPHIIYSQKSAPVQAGGIQVISSGLHYQAGWNELRENTWNNFQYHYFVLWEHHKPICISFLFKANQTPLWSLMYAKILRIEKIKQWIHICHSLQQMGRESSKPTAELQNHIQLFRTELWASTDMLNPPAGNS